MTISQTYGSRPSKRPWGRTCAFLGGVLLASASMAAAQNTAAAEPEVIETYQDWVLSCVSEPAGTEACSILHDRRTEGGSNGENGVTAELRLQEDGDIVAILLLPFGLSVQSGIEARVGSEGDPRSAPILTCLPNGCLATFEVDPPLLDEMRAGTTMSVGITSLSGQALTYPVSLLGLTKALEDLSRRAEG